MLELDKLPKEFRWEKQVAKRKNKRGRPIGGMMTDIREEEGRTKIIKIEEKREGVMSIELQRERERWRMGGVYVNGDIDRKLEELEEWLEEQEEGADGI